MPMHKLIEDTDNHPKTSAILEQNYRDKPVVNVANGNIVHFDAAKTTTDSFKKKKKWHVGQFAMAKKMLKTTKMTSS